LHLARFGHSLQNHVNRRLRILVLSQIVTKPFQCKLDVARPEKLGPRSLQDCSDFIGQGGLLQQVRSLGARAKLDTLAFAQPGQGLKGLAQDDNAPFCFLSLG
jgi:hypothetical protein